MTIIYGINNCDTVKKALRWLHEHQIAFQFHDYKKQGLTANLLNEFVRLSEWPLLLNKKSTTFRQLPPAIKALALSNQLDDDVAFAHCIKQPTLLKRPILIKDNQLHLGFSPALYQELFQR